MDKTFFEQETNEVILYILHKKVYNMYNILKIIYYANQEHFIKHGSFFTNDVHYALPDGQVPSMAYNIIKYFRDGEKAKRKFNIKKEFKVKKDSTLVPSRGPKMDYLSKSAIECLDNMIKKIGKMSIDELKQYTQYDQAFMNTEKQHIITPMKIAQYAPNKEELMEYLAMR